MNFSVCFVRYLTLVVSIFSSQFLFAQTPAKWSVNGNATSNGDFLGTTNNNPVVFYANNTEWMRLKANGDLKINSLSGTGNNFIFSNSTGVLYTKPFSSDTDRFMTEAGVFRTASSFTGWKFNGNNIHTITGSFVGIGTNNPQYQLDVAGDARLYGTLYAQGLILATKLQADTVKSTSMISINNNLSFFSGTVNDIYTTSGDVRLQSRVGYGGNTIMNAGNNGNVGIGIYAPQYKFDVNGDARVSGKIHVFRILPLAGDSFVYFGDSSIAVSGLTNRIECHPLTNFGGLAIGFDPTTQARGFRSLSLGYKAIVSPGTDYSIVIGSGVQNGNGILINNISNSLMVGFNSTLPTFFVGSASGPGTFGKVGIGTSIPHCQLDVIAPLNTGGFCVTTNYNIPYGYNIWAQVNGNPLTKAIAVVDQNANDQFIVYGDGTVFAREFKVTLGVFSHPDYIFENNYHLMSLDSLSLFVKTNKHLPGVPSTADVKKNDGINLGEMTEANLAKTEELYLYLLQLNDELQAMKEQNLLLQSQIDELKNK